MTPYSSLSPRHIVEDSFSSSCCASSSEDDYDEPRVATIDKKKAHKQYPRLITKHNYHDRGQLPVSKVVMKKSGRGGVTTPFPIKLYNMLNKMERKGTEPIVSWQPHGRCFVIRSVAPFKTILKDYFHLSKIASFQRQLNLYGFVRLTTGADKGGYYHECFLRGRLDLVSTMQRCRVKGTGIRAKSNPDQEPNLYSYPKILTASSKGGDSTVVASRRCSSTEANSSSSSPPAPSSTSVRCPTTSSTKMLSSSSAAPSSMTLLRLTSTSAPKMTLRCPTTSTPPKMLPTTPVRPLAPRPRVVSTIEYHKTPTILEPPTQPDFAWRGDETATMVSHEDSDLSFDKLLQEMFDNDQQIQFEDLLELASM